MKVFEGIIKTERQNSNGLYEKVFLNDYELYSGDIFKYEISGKMMDVEVVLLEDKHLVFKILEQEENLVVVPYQGRRAAIQKDS